MAFLKQMFAEFRIVRRGLSGPTLCGATRHTQVRASLRLSLRHREQYSGHSTQVTGSHRQLEVLIDPPQSAVHGLADMTNSLAPIEMLFNSRSDGLADLIPGMPRCAPIDRAAPHRRS
jgi:hypothetical protein